MFYIRVLSVYRESPLFDHTILPRWLTVFHWNRHWICFIVGAHWNFVNLLLLSRACSLCPFSEVIHFESLITYGQMSDVIAQWTFAYQYFFKCSRFIHRNVTSFHPYWCISYMWRSEFPISFVCHFFGSQVESWKLRDFIMILMS